MVQVDGDRKTAPKTSRRNGLEVVHKGRWMKEREMENGLLSRKTSRRTGLALGKRGEGVYGQAYVQAFVIMRT